jgi:hypothetical protein
MGHVAKAKSRAELQAENRLLRRYRQGETVTSIVTTAIRWTGAIAISWIGYLCIQALSGQQTFADIGVSVLADVRISQALAWLLGGGGVAYGLGQRKLRRDTVERLQGRNQRLERERDPRRSSSQLTPRGETNPEDK